MQEVKENMIEEMFQKIGVDEQSSETSEYFLLAGRGSKIEKE